MKGITIALDRHDRGVIALLTRAADNGDRVTVPVTALGQAIRNHARQVRLIRLIRQPYTDLIPLTADDAKAVGILLAGTGTSDIVDARVVICARRADQPVVTSDPRAFNRIDPTLDLEVTEPKCPQYTNFELPKEPRRCPTPPAATSSAWRL